MMKKLPPIKLAGALALAIMIGASGAAQAGGEKDQSSTWALGNILHGLANALNGSDEPKRAAAVQTSEVGAGPGLEGGVQALDRTRQQGESADDRAAGVSDEGTGS